MTLTIQVPDEQEAALQAKADAEGVSVEECAGELIKEALAPRETKQPLATRIREIWADMPDEVRAKLPADGASQHDHYIYGVPKREQ
jgi:plasmid stability protein